MCRTTSQKDLMRENTRTVMELERTKSVHSVSHWPYSLLAVGLWDSLESRDMQS